MKALGWVLFLLAAAVATGEFYLFQSQKAEALAAQAADYETRLAAQKAQSDAAIKKLNDDATAAAQVMQTDLDFAKMPEIPLKTQFRPGQVLYVENESDEPVSCKVKMFRPIGAVTREYEFSMKNRTFKDIAAIEDWLFQRGDTIEFNKPGYKPRKLTVP